MSELRELLERGKMRKVLALVEDDEDLMAELIGYLDDSDEEVRRAAFRALSMAEDTPALAEALPSLIGGLESDDEEICRFAAEALSRLGVEAAEAVGPLGDLLGHEDEEVRRAAARALGSVGPAAVEVLDRLVAALEDGDEGGRGEAALALGSLGPDAAEAVPSLVRALADEEEFRSRGRTMEVRQAAQQALVQIGSAAVLGLLEALRDDKTDVRCLAATTLGKIGSLPQEAMRGLEEAASQDPDQSVRQAARSALKKAKAS